MPQFITPGNVSPIKTMVVLTTSLFLKYFQDYGDSVHRACWTLASKCKKCGDVFVYDTQFGVFGLFDDLNKGAYVLEL